MTKQQARSAGRDAGWDIAMGVMAEDPALSLEEVEDAVEECEEQARQTSPFEFLAKELNDADDDGELWRAYDEGVAEGAGDAYMRRHPNREDTMERRRSMELVPVLA